MKLDRKDITDSIPANYKPWLHKTIPTAVGFFILLYCCLLITWGVWMIPVAVLALFGFLGFEWMVHRYILHRQTFPLQDIHHKHINHHLLFSEDTMEMRSNRETYLVMMPLIAILAVLLFISPLIACLYFSFGFDCAGFVLALMILFFLSYEWLHYSYHLPVDSVIGGSKFLARLKQHHRRHHSWNNMKKYNFNVTIPLFDWILGTKIK